MDQQTLHAFSDEVQEIIKEAGIMSFLKGGIKGIKGLFTGKGAVAAGRKAHGGALGHMKKIYETGGQQAAKVGPITPWQRRMGGLKALARSRYGQMAAVGAGGVGAAGLGASALRRRGQ